MSATFNGSYLRDRRSWWQIKTDGFRGGGSLYFAGGLVTLEYSVQGGFLLPGDNLLRDVIVTGQPSLASQVGGAPKVKSGLHVLCVGLGEWSR